MPVVDVANGPATVHSAYLLLCDVHIASERATYGDLPHTSFGITAGDGLHVVWDEIAGTARAKGLLWTGEHIDAGPRSSGVWWGRSFPTNERSIAGSRSPRGLAIKPALYRTLQKQTLNLKLHRRIIEDVPFGMALDGLTAADLPYQNQG